MLYLAKSGFLCYNIYVDMNTKYHIIRNFPKGYPWYKKLWANIMFMVSTTVIHPRRNSLTQDDIRKTAAMLRRGDVVLVGNKRKVSGVFISGPLTHGMLYVGRKKFLHSISDGVEIAPMYKVLTSYDTLMILRPRVKDRTKINNAISWAKKQLGKPFDFEFSNDDRKFYCMELLEFAFSKAGVRTDVRREHGWLLSRYSKKTMIHPMDYIRANFDIMFKSHNLAIDEKEVIMKK